VKILPAAQIGKVEATLFAPACLDLPNPLVYANFRAQCDAAARRSLLSRNLPRRLDMQAVTLLRYPKDALVYGDRSYLTVAGGCIVQEQVAGWCVDPAGEAGQMCAHANRAIDVAENCLLLARFGENTWGHWVAEMLVKAVIAERFFPGRFRYVVPGWTTELQAPRGYADSVLESLAAYGISPNRLLRMGGFQFYRFAALHDISGFWQDGLHPGALESLRMLNLPKTGGRKRRRIAVLRRPPEARAVHNAGEIRSILTSQGFSAIDLGTQSFAAQVRMFREADLVVGSLGSSFTAALYAPLGQKIVSVAPADWADGYFIRMFRHIQARHADLRGASIAAGGEPEEFAPHLVDPKDLAEAIDAVLAWEETGTCTVDGEVLPRRLGATLLSLSFAQTEHFDAEVTGTWSAPEPSHRWSLGESSGLTISRAGLPSDVPLWLEIEGQGHVYPPRLPTRPLKILLGGQLAGSFDVIGRARYICRLTPAMLAGEGPIALTFLHPICPSPRMMGAGADDRPLGFGFEKLVVYASAE
jgi:hypothetical protein